MTETYDPALAAEASYLAQYANYADTAQMYAGTDLGVTVAGTAVLFLIAADAERNNPEPRHHIETVCCLPCRLYRVAGDKGMPALESFVGLGR